LAEKQFVSMQEIGSSFEGRPINLLQIGNPESKKLMMVLSRQHPPEITGWLAMKWFVETLCEENSVAEKFRDEYCVFVVPMVNPDGVDNGHWRHNSGGIDLNRDWEDFNQPETKAIKHFMEQQVAKGGKFYFGIDFHSTFEDIYYTIDPKMKGNMPGLVPDLINSVAEEIQGYEPNIRPNDLNEPKISSTSFFFYNFGAEAVTYEIGDGTSRELIRKKGELTAQKLMEIMNEKIE
jgi:cytosolic carboxypeptidase protein 6